MDCLFSASQGVAQPDVPYSFRKIPPLKFFWAGWIQFRSLNPVPLNVRYNIYPTIVRSTKWPISFSFSKNIPARIFHLRHTCHIIRLSYRLIFYRRNSIWRETKFTKLLITQFSAAPSSSFPLSHKYIYQCPVLKRPQPVSFH